MRSLAFASIIAIVFLVTGCAEKNLKGSVIRCPKCGGYFQTKEGAQEFHHILPR